MGRPRSRDAAECRRGTPQWIELNKGRVGQPPGPVEGPEVCDVWGGLPQAKNSKNIFINISVYYYGFIILEYTFF